MSRGCRIGKIRLKSNGAEIHQIPSAREKLSERQFAQLKEMVGHIKKHYAGKLDGYALIAWDHDGYWVCDTRSGTAKHALTLPEFVADAIRQDYAKCLTADMVDKMFE